MSKNFIIEKLKERFPKAIFSADGSWRITEDNEAENWEAEPVCFKTDCLSEDIAYYGYNPIHETECYVCRSCTSVLVQGVERKAVGGNIGNQADLEDVE